MGDGTEMGTREVWRHCLQMIQDLEGEDYIERPNGSKTAQRLEGLGLVVVKPHPTSRRLVCIALTPRGQKFVRQRETR